MIVIEEARAALKRWRENLSPSVTEPLRWGSLWEHEADGLFPAGGGPLIVGTAGNPDLLDAIDLGLAFYESEADITQVPEVTALIATAILRADKEMQK